MQWMRIWWPMRAILLLVATGCEKAEDAQLVLLASPHPHIEARLADDGRPCTVRLSWAPNRQALPGDSLAPIRGATVALRDAAGPLELLRETRPGYYTGARLLRKADHGYTLTVLVEGQTYTATATLPRPVPLTGPHLEATTFGPAQRLNVVPEYADPAGVRNYYCFRQYVNGRRCPAHYLQDDALTDGNANRQPLRGSGDDNDPLNSGDQLRVELRNVDAAGYAYMRARSHWLASSSASNFSGGARGYFSTYAVQQRTLVVP